MDENMENKNPTPEEQSQSQEQPQGQTTPPPNPEPTPPTAQTPPPAESASVSNEAKQWGMFCHLAGLLGYLPVIPFPVGNVLGPLIIWLIKKDEMPSVNDQGKEALNFQISMSIYGLICLPLICLAGLGAILFGIVGIVDLVFIIIASIESNKGKLYRYPMTIRMIK